VKLHKIYADSSAIPEDILAFTETWLKPEISDSEVLCNNFNTYRTDRSPRRGGGVLSAVTSTLTSERIYFHNHSDIEFVGVKVSLESFSIYVTCSNISPESDLTIYEQHLSAVKTVFSFLSERDLLIVLGDFNLPDND